MALRQAHTPVSFGNAIGRQVATAFPLTSASARTKAASFAYSTAFKKFMAAGATSAQARQAAETARTYVQGN